MDEAEYLPAAPGPAFSLQHIIEEMWHRRWLGLGVAWAVGSLAALILFMLPDRYETKARVYVDTQTIIQPLLQGLTVQPDIDQMVQMLARTLVTRANIERLLATTGIDQTLTPNKREALIDSLEKGIKFNAGAGKNLYDLSYRDTDGERGRKIVEALVNLFVTTGAGDKIRDTQDARKFIDQQIAEHEQKLSEAEARLKDFKVSTLSANGVGTTNGQDYFQRVAQLQQELAGVRTDLNGAEQSRDALRRQVAAERDTPVATTNVAVVEIDGRIAAQQKQLDDLRHRFTDDHPDVVDARRVLGQLKEDRQRLLAEAKNGTLPHDETGNLALAQMKVKLAEADALVENLRGRFNSMNARLSEMRSQATQIPGQEAELARLNRDYDVIKKNYEQLVQRREAASISGSADEDAHLAEFRVVEAPRLEPRPVFPSHIITVPLALIVSLAAGALAALYGGMLRPVVYSSRDLRGFGGRPLLGSISFQADEQGLAHEKQMNLNFVYATGALVLLYLIWTGFALFRLGSA